MRFKKLVSAAVCAALLTIPLAAQAADLFWWIRR